MTDIKNITIESRPGADYDFDDFGSTTVVVDFEDITRKFRIGAYGDGKRIQFLLNALGFMSTCTEVV